MPGVQTHFNGIADEGNVGLPKGQLFSSRNALLQLDQADGLAAHPRNAFGDGVLNLDARIDFEKVGVRPADRSEIQP